MKLRVRIKLPEDAIRNMNKRTKVKEDEDQEGRLEEERMEGV